MANMERAHVQSWKIRPGDGLKIEILPNEKIKIVTPYGGQVVDITFNDFSQSLTRNFCMKLKAEEGTLLYDKNYNPVLEIVEKKTLSNIDLIFPGCSSEIYKDGRPGCRDIIAKVLCLKKRELPDVVSIFMDVYISLNGDIKIQPSSSKPGDYVVLKALRNVEIGISCCPDDIVACPNPSIIIIEKMSDAEN